MTSWYEQVANDTPLTQGDIVSLCPVLTWTNPATFRVGSGQLAAETGVELHDVVVMSQACDLEQKKLSEVILCPLYPLSEFKARWEAAQQAKNPQNAKPNAAAWQKFCKHVKSGYQWNLSMLNICPEPPVEHRVVEFYRVYSTPRSIIETLLLERGGSRSRLKAPYREHLSQAFARFFMRVGLPVDIADSF